MPRVVLSIIGVVAAVVAVGIDLQLLDRYGTYVSGGHLSSRPLHQLVAIIAVGPLVGVGLIIIGALVVAPSGRGMRTALASVVTALIAGLSALVVGVGTAAALQFNVESTVLVATLVALAYTVVLVLRMRRMAL